jgi:hypothetical protein
VEVKDGRQPGLDLVGPASWNWWFYMMVGGFIFLVLPLPFKEKTRKAVRGWVEARREKWPQWRDKARDMIGWRKCSEWLGDKMYIHTQSVDGRPIRYVCPPRKSFV